MRALWKRRAPTRSAALAWLVIVVAACHDTPAPPPDAAPPAEVAATDSTAEDPRPESTAARELTPPQVFARFQEGLRNRDAAVLFALIDPDLTRREGMTLQVLEALMAKPDLPDGWDGFLDQTVATVEVRADSAVLTMQRADGTRAPAFRLRRVDDEWKVVGQR